MKYFLLFTFFAFIFAKPTLAIYDPLSQTNNRVGVHVLSPDEIERAAKFVNHDGQAEWGYITVPIQSTDRDRDKWIRFMQNAARLKVIPIIRVATTGVGAHWEEPGNNDLIDFANFLNDLPWPTQNHYVIIFNEVNRADEFGGIVDPEKYADILYNAIDIFKSRSDRFFILPAGLDNAAPNNDKFMRWDIFLTRMYQHQPEIFNRIDGWTSHAYGNPDFSADPLKSGANKADSFKYDLNFLDRFTKKKLPVFITEAGWSNSRSNSQTIANFYNFAFTNIWSNDRIVCVTPFLLFANTEPFKQFSLINSDGTSTLAYQTIQKYATSGSPIVEDYSPKPVSENSDLAQVIEPAKVLAAENPPAPSKPTLIEQINNFLKKIFSFLSPNRFAHQITIGDKKYFVEIVRSAHDQAVGLAKYEYLNKDNGMLFQFFDREYRSFWMKDMKFDIDIVWIANDKVIGVDQGLFKDEFKSIRSPGPVDYVLEVNPNSGIKVGDALHLSK